MDRGEYSELRAVFYVIKTILRFIDDPLFFNDSGEENLCLAFPHDGVQFSKSEKENLDRRNHCIADVIRNCDIDDLAAKFLEFKFPFTHDSYVGWSHRLFIAVYESVDLSDDASEYLKLLFSVGNFVD